MQKFDKKITKSGMTLLEILIVVAIMVILFGVGTPAVHIIKKNLEWKKANGIAEEIYMVAQNQAIHLKSTNALGEEDSSNASVAEDSSATLDDENETRSFYELATQNTDHKVVTKPSDYTESNAKYKNLYYITDEESGAISYIIPKVTQETIEGSYIIEINPNSGDVYGVFYSETMSTSQLLAAYESGTKTSAGSKLESDTIRSAEARRDYEISDKSEKHMIGYYGGGEAGLSGEGTEISIKAYNKEQLYIKVNIPGASMAGFSDSNFNIDFVIQDEHGNKIIRSGNTANNDNDTDISKPICVENKDSGTNGSVDVYLILDDSLNETSTKFAELNPGLTPGDDLTIYANASYIYYDGESSKYITTKLDNTTNSVVVNSLFANGTEISDDVATESNIKVSNCRQLRNLENFRNDTAWATENSDIRINQQVTIYQTRDINFAKLQSNSTSEIGICPAFRANGTIDGSDGVDDCGLSFTGSKTFKEINNPFLFGCNTSIWTAGDNKTYSNVNNKYNGQGNEIKNLYIKSDSTTGVGLFGEYNCKVVDVHLRDIRVEATGNNSAGTGALIGDGSGGDCVVKDCGVYCTSVSEDEVSIFSKTYDGKKPIVTGYKNVGGIVGVIKNTRLAKTAKIKNSFAAINVKSSDGAAGGLVGSIVEDFNLYKLTANEESLIKYRMNFYGDLYSDDNDVYFTVLNCYSSGDVTGPFNIGGICGSSQGGIKNCYSTSDIEATAAHAHCGGLVGKFWDCARLLDCTYYGKVTSHASGDAYKTDPSYYAGVLVDVASKSDSYDNYWEVEVKFEGKKETATCEKYRCRDSLAGSWKFMTISGCTYLRADGYNDNLSGSLEFTSDGLSKWIKEGFDESTGYDGTCPMELSAYNLNEYLKSLGTISTFLGKLGFDFDTSFIHSNDYNSLSSDIDNDENKSFPYDEELEDEAFPFEMVSEIGYHFGDWPDMEDNKKFKIKNGLIYYELYTDGTYGYYSNVLTISGNAGSINTLRSGLYVRDAGYAVISSTTETFDIEVDGATTASTKIGTIDPSLFNADSSLDKDDVTVNAYKLSKAAVGTRSKYYLNCSVNGTDYYYNPDVAMSAATSNAEPSDAIVRTAEQLYRIGKNEYYLDKSGFTFTQGLNIDYTTYDGGSDFQNVPIGSTTSGGKTFASTYDGAGYEIRGYNLDASSGNAGKAQCYGLFSQVSGTIQNVHLVGDGTNTISVNYSSNSNGAAVGGLVGWLNGGTITNSTVSGYEITASGSNSKIVVGGLVGEVQSGAISNSTAVNKTVGVTDSGSSCVGVGGLVGALNSGSVKNAYAGGAIQCNNTSAVLGGLTGEDKSTVIGPCSGTTGNSTVSSCYSYCTYDNEKTYSKVNGVSAGATATKCYYFDETGYDKMATDPSGVTAVTFNKLKNADLGTESGTFGTADKSHSYPWDALGKNYPFKAVVKDTSNNYVHYGNWPTANKFNGTVGIIRQYKYKGNTYYEVSAVVVEKGVITDRIEKERGLTSIPSYASSATFTNKNDWCVFWYEADAGEGEVSYSKDSGATSNSMPSEGTGADSAGNTKDAISVQFMYDGSTFATVELDALIGNGTVGIIRQYKKIGDDTNYYEVCKLVIEEGKAISKETKRDLTSIPDYASEVPTKKGWYVFWSDVDNDLVEYTAKGATTSDKVTKGNGCKRIGNTSTAINAIFTYDASSGNESLGSDGNVSLSKLSMLSGKMGVIRRIKSGGKTKYQIHTVTATYKDGRVTKEVSDVATYTEEELTKYAEYATSAAAALTEKNQWCAFWYGLTEESGYELTYGESKTIITTATGHSEVATSKDEVSMTFLYNEYTKDAQTVYSFNQTLSLPALNKLSGTVGVIRKYKPRGSSDYKYQVCELVISDNTVTTTNTYTGDTAKDAIPSDIASASTAINNSLKNSNEWCVFSSNLNVDTGEDITYTIGTSSTEITASDSASAANSGTDEVSVQFKYGDTELGIAELPALKKLSGTIGVIRQYKPRGSDSYKYEIDKLVIKNGAVTNTGHSRERYDNYDELCKNAKYAQSAADNLSGNNSWCNFWYELSDETAESITYGSVKSTNPATIVADSVTGNSSPGNGWADINMQYKYAGSDLGTTTLTALSKLSGTIGVIRQYKPRGSDSYKYEIDRLVISNGAVTNTSHSRERYDSLNATDFPDSAKAAATKLASENENNKYCIFWSGLTDESGETLRYGSTEILGTDGNTTPVTYKDAISVDFTYGDNALGTTNLAALTRLSGTVGIIRQYTSKGETKYQVCKLDITSGTLTNKATNNTTSIPDYASEATISSKNEWCVFWSDLSDESSGTLTYGTDNITITSSSGSENKATSKKTLNVVFSYDGNEIGTATLEKLGDNGYVGILQTYKYDGDQWGHVHGYHIVDGEATYINVYYKKGTTELTNIIGSISPSYPSLRSIKYYFAFWNVNDITGRWTYDGTRSGTIINANDYNSPTMLDNRQITFYYDGEKVGDTIKTGW